LLIATDYFYPHWTGIAKSILYLTKGLQKDFSISVLTVRFEDFLKKEEMLGTVQIIRSGYLFTLSRSKYSFSTLFVLLSKLGSTDVVLVNAPSANVLPFAILTKLFRKRLLIFYQGDLILPEGMFNRVLEKIFDMSSFIAFSLADKVSTYTEDYAKSSRLLRHFLHKIHPLILPIHIESNREKKVKKIEAFKKEKKVLFGFAGRFVEEKGFDILFDAIPFILKKIPDAHFVFAGQQYMPYENFFQKNQELFEKVKNHITFLGLLDSEELVYFYKNIEFIVVPSRSDCFNLVQGEAMLCGTPVIASNIPGLRHLVRESGFGVLFDSSNPHDLAEKLIEAYEKKAVIMKAKGRALALLDNKSNVEKIARFIAERS